MMICKLRLLVSGLCLVALPALADPAAPDDFPPPPVTRLDATIEAKVDTLLGQLTQDEKISLISGPDTFFTQGIPRLNIPALKFSDASAGVRCWGPSTAYPATVLLAATWDAAAAREVGVSLGRDARARGVHVLLAPGVNICREAQNGRNFEYMGEDPFLASILATEYIRGLQSQGVAGCVKHFAMNEQETQRGSVNEIVGKRALEEIYFPPFRAAVQDANVWCAMAAYNKINGDWCTANHYLLTDVLRDEWGFKGLVMSDWGAVHDTALALNAGTDLEMNGQHRVFYNGQTIPPLIAAGTVTQATLDEHVRRMLRLIVSMGFMDRNQTDSSIPMNDPTSAATAEKLAGEGIVLLKNDQALLPLDRQATHHLVVTGPNADEAVIGGGGSSEVHPFSKTSVLDGLKAVAGAGVDVADVPDLSLRASASSVLRTSEDQGGTVQGLAADYFATNEVKGTPVAHRVDPEVDFDWGNGAPVAGITGGSAFAVRWQGSITAPEMADYVFTLQNDNRAVVYLDDKQIITSSHRHGMGHKEVILPLEKGRTYKLRIEYVTAGGYSDVHFGWARLGYTPEQVKQLAAADAIVFAGGLNPALEHEGADRDWDIPPVQATELRQLLEINPRVIVAINAGGNLGLGGNLDQIPALLWAWYPGQNGNTALAKIIFGDINPSGHLPDTFEKRFEDSPAYGNFPGDPANGGSVHLDEGIYVGYRWYDKKQIAPAFPFGFGLSYTTFALKNAQVRPIGPAVDDRFDVSVQVTNTGSRAGAEVVQLYVHPPASSSDRPVQELKAFARVNLQPGESRTVTLPLDRHSFAIYDEASSSWRVPPGDYRIAIGGSSRDEAVTAHATVAAANW